MSVSCLARNTLAVIVGPGTPTDIYAKYAGEMWEISDVQGRTGRLQRNKYFTTLHLISVFVVDVASLSVSVGFLGGRTQ